MPPRRARIRRSPLLALSAGCVCLPLANSAEPGAPADDGHFEFFDLPPFVVEGVRERPEMVPLSGDATRPSTTASLTGALAATPGLIVQESGDGFYPPRITVRGSGLQSAPVSRGLLLRLDSLPLNAADGSFNLALLEPGFFCASTFQPGAADSSVAGQALGGALDLSWWRRPRETHGDAMVTIGRDGFVRAVAREANGQAYGTRSTFGHPSWAGAVAFTRSDGWRPNGEQERLVATGRAEWSTLGGFTHGLSLYAVRADLRIPGPLTLAAAESARDTISAAAAVDLPRRTTDYARLVYRAAWKDEFEAALGVQTTDDDFRQLRANGIAVTRGADVLGRVSGRWHAGRMLTFEVGASGSYGARTQERHANLAGARGASFADLQLQAGTGTGWLDAMWKPVATVTLKGGVSAVAARRATSGTEAAAGAMSATALAPHLEFAASPSARRLVEGFVRAERGFEAPTFDDVLAVRGTAPNLALGWTPLRIQQADTVAVGLRGRFGQPNATSDRLSFEVTAYTSQWHHELLRLADANGSPRGTVNAGPTRHRGVESQLRWRLLAGERTLDLALVHTWSEARFAHDPVYGTGRRAGLPPQVGSVQLSYAQEKGCFATLGTSWVSGTTYADHANQLGFAGHTLANAQLGWKARRWTASLAVANLFDRRYNASPAGVLDLARTPATTALFLPGNPRSFTATLEWRW